MKEFVNTISKNNKAIIESYKNDFGKILSSQNDKELFLSEAYLYLYIQINKTIFALENKDNNSTTVTNLFDELTELKRIFFKFLQKKFYSNNWENIAGLMQNYNDEFMYISSSMFNEKHLDLVIQRLYKHNDLVSNLTMPKKQILEKIHFEVAVEFANGKIYDFIKKKISQKKISEIIFINRKYSPKSYYPFINKSLSQRTTNFTQNIFKRNNAEMELNEVIRYCYSNNYTISPDFLEDCKRNNLDLEL